MTKNPFFNALAAVAYITVIATFFHYAQVFLGNKPDTLLAPVTMLSLLVFSAAFMGLTFFYNPVRMYLDGDKVPAVSLLARTVGVFGTIVAALVVLSFVLSLAA